MIGAVLETISSNQNQSEVSACYVVTANSESTYPAMLSISAMALRLAEPDVRIILLTTKSSLPHISAQISDLNKVVDEVITRDIPAGLSPMQASRYLKTRLRQFVEGPLIYLDVDTLPVRPFVSNFDVFKFDFVAAADLNAGFPYPYFPRRDRVTFTSLGWPCPTPNYVNGGVMGWSNSKSAYRLSEKWCSSWLQTIELGINVDQPSLNHALDVSSAKVGILPKSCNAMVAATPWLARKAHILHFYTAKGQPDSNTILAELVSTFRQTGKVDNALIDRARRGDVWQTNPPWSAWVKGIVPVRKTWHTLTGNRKEFRLRKPN